MAMFVRAKRVSDPLDDSAKARLRDSDDVSVVTADGSFSGAIHAFLDVLDDDDRSSAESTDRSSDRDDVDDNSYDDAETIRDLLGNGDDDPFLRRLRSDVTRALTSAEERTRRSVTKLLREYGYNAGICEARWQAGGGGLTAGRYEYIDVVDDAGERCVVDLGFAAEFELARATEGYARLAAALPGVAVGRGEEVGRAVRVMAEAARRSMKSRGLHLPPWRKRRYMMAKWFGPYRRTVDVNPVSADGVPVADAAGGEVVKCRAVGFGLTTAATERVVVLTTTTR